jgi:hypothetical protein
VSEVLAFMALIGYSPGRGRRVTPAEAARPSEGDRQSAPRAYPSPAFSRLREPSGSQALHPTRPVLLLDLHQRLQLPQVVRVAQGMQHALQGVVRLPMVMYDNTADPTLFERLHDFHLYAA